MTGRDSALFFGAASEVVTPFTADGEVDVGALTCEIEFMLENDIKGLFINGLASEALMMDENERLRCARTILAVVRKRVPIMGNIIANSTNIARAVAREYELLGVDAIGITPPILYKYTSGGLFEYFDAVASQTSLPVYIYNAPETGNKLSPQLVAKLFEANVAFAGYKDSTQSIIEQQTLVSLIPEERHFELISGSDAQITATMMLGGVGVISLITVVFPKLIVDTVAACERGDKEEAVKLQARVLKVREALKTGPFMAAYKYVSARLGRNMGYMKHPLVDMNEADGERIDAMLSAQGLL